MTKLERKRQIRRRVSFFILGCLTLVIVIMYVVARNNCKVYYNGTIINGCDCSGLTIEEAKELLEKSDVENINIIFKGNQIESIKTISYKVPEEKLEKIKEQQKKQILFLGKKYNIKFSYDKYKIKTELSNLKQLQKNFMDKNSKFFVVYNEQKSKFESKCQCSYYLNIDDVVNQVIQSLEKGENSVIISNKYYQIPRKVGDEKELNKKISAKIRYELPNGQEFILDAKILHNWIVKKNKTYQYNEDFWNECIEKFVSNELKQLAETVGKERKFIPTGKDEAIIVSGGNYGYQINIESEIAELKENLKMQKDVIREPIYKKVEAATDEDGLGYSYVEIDLSRQKVWVYLNGKKQIETDCVSGCVEKSHETPEGVFSLTYKQKDRILRGEKLPDGQYEYQSHVNFWMPFNGGIGLHDATWRSKFGGDIYVTNGSHGCINLPKDKAEKIYDIIDKNMPIIVYK